MTNANNACFVVARSTSGAWYSYRSTFSAADYAGRTDCFACDSESEAWNMACDLNDVA